MNEKQSGIIDVFNEEPYAFNNMGYVEENLGRNSQSEDMGDEWLVDLFVSVYQKIPEEDQGGGNEEYFTINVTVKFEDGYKYVVYTSYDTSHIYENIDTILGNYIEKKLNGSFVRSNYSDDKTKPDGCNFEHIFYAPTPAIEAALKLHSLLDDLSVNNNGTVSNM